MAKLKKGTVTLQTEVKNEDEWNNILQKEGLIVVDIYSDWSGPCTAMVSTLKKIKMELGGDLLNFVLARSDEITALERFRGKSEPVWMFIQNGKMINIVFGSHCPNLKKTLIEEIKRIQDNETPKYQLSIEQRAPDEEVRFIARETIKRQNELQKRLREEAIEESIYEKFLEYMMIELSEETALVIFPWVFVDKNGHARDKEQSPPYLELTLKILPDRFDITEQTRLQLDENIIQNMFKESKISVNDDLIYTLTEGKCMIMRLKGRLPPSSWPVPYPHVCKDESKKCPTRAINDIENFLRHILEEVTTSSDQDTNPQSFIDRHKLIIDSSEEQEEKDEEIMSFPAVWCPTNARNKVHVFKTLFTSYMDRVYPYEEPKKPIPLIAFKFDISKLSLILDNDQQFQQTIEYFGVFEFDDPNSKRLASSPQNYLDKSTNQTGNEIILIIVRRLNENVFLAFAGNSPIFIEENEEAVVEIIHKYFPEGAVDFDPGVFSQDHFEEIPEDYYECEEYSEDKTYY